MSAGPFEKSQWIWPGLPCLDLINVFAQFRRTFRLAKTPRRAEICVTADAAYQLFVNNRYICRGPARGWQIEWPFDRVDIAPFLRKGRNVIAVRAYNPGVHTCKYLHQGWAGFILAGRAAGVDLSTGTEEWRARTSPGHLRNLSRLSAQMEFQEHFDARLEDDWRRVGYDDSQWGKGFPYKSGVDPWPAFSERGIPLLREDDFLRPQSIVLESDGAGSPLKDCVVRTCLSEQQAWRPATLKLNRYGKLRAFNAAPVKPGMFVSYVMDFGVEITGCVRLQAAGARGGEVVDIISTERLRDGKPLVFDPDQHAGRAPALASRVILGKGCSEYENFHYWGFRYLMVIIRGPAPRLNIRVDARLVGYPLTGASNFTTSSKRLNRIFECCYRSQQCCMTDAYMDCPGFEQAMWWGDAHVQSFATHYLMSDNRLFRRGIEIMARHKSPAGVLYGLAPAHLYNWVMPDYTLSWIWSHWEYCWRTGDIRLFRQLAPEIESIMAYYPSFLDAKRGLLRTDDRWLLLLDSSPVCRGPVSTLSNMFYLKALQDLAELCGAAAMTGLAQKYRRRAAAIARALRAGLFDRQARVFYGGLDRSGKPLADPGVLCDAFAILTDIMPENNHIFGRRLAEMCARAIGPDTPNIGMGMFYVFEAMKKSGYNRPVLECIDRLWGEMNIARGETATLEHWWTRPNEGGSRCHAWSAHPIVHFFNILLGVTQTDMAWRRMRFAPVLALTDRVGGQVPTPHGLIEAGWRIAGGQAEIRLQVPAGITAEIEIGRIKKTLKGPFKKRFVVRV